MLLPIRIFIYLSLFSTKTLALAVNHTVKLTLHGAIYDHKDNKVAPNQLIDIPRNSSLYNSIIPAAYYVTGILNSAEFKFYIDLESSAIYIYENYCEDCVFELDPTMKEYSESSRVAISSVVKYCQVSYRACEYFEDDYYSGYYTKQQLAYEEAFPDKIGIYVVRNVLEASRRTLFASPSVFGIMGLGRSDFDNKYQHSTREEFISRYGLQTDDVGIHFHPKGILSFGKKLLVENLKNVEVYRFPIINTHRISVKINAIQLSLQDFETKAVSLQTLDVRKELYISSTTQYSYLPMEVFNAILNVTQSLIEQHKKNESTLLSFSLKDSKLLVYFKVPLNATISSAPEHFAELFQIFLLHNIESSPISLSNLFILTGCQPYSNTSQNCTYLLAISPSSVSNPPCLGLHFLHGRYLQISSETFMLTSPLIPSLLREAHYEDTDYTGPLCGFMIGVLFLIPILYKTAQACIKTVSS
jgi:hypothetical protein